MMTAEFKVHLIHRKQVPLFHNTVLILCDEGDGLVAVFLKIDAWLWNVSPFRNGVLLTVDFY